MILEPPLLGGWNKPIRQAQDEHISQFNALGKVMASCADYYAAVKLGDATLTASLREDIRKGWIISSDRIAYCANSLDATITSYFGSSVVQSSERKVMIPVYRKRTKLDDVLASEQGLLYIQTLFNTSDSADEIKNTLIMLTGEDSRSAMVWTPDQDSRRNYSIRVAALEYLGDFSIHGDIYLVFGGIARGIKSKVLV